ncbi:hypothetical protein YC2023_043623 [Brassica napus]
MTANRSKPRFNASPSTDSLSSSPLLTTAPDLPRSLALPLVDSVPTTTSPPLMRPKSAAMSQRLASGTNQLSN